ncbi:hypothetical protein NLG97_g5933 [Lecanicillium saksenae]|uniref:Uncharacterized protein n=1 Tax=Lecanicillium saksenae TaxID=468837 RepID=A0ACC1QSR3_9HYPO|nr:hypothetical protein NLG97_g5933 [Lecanicillium saksenae]
MTEMAVSPIDNGPNGPPKPAKNRQFSLYATRIKPIEDDEPPPLPQPAMPIMPRWDSLQNSAHLMAASPTSDAFPKDVFYDAPEQPKSPLSANFREEFPPLAFDEPLPSPNRVLSAKSSNADMPQHQAALAG